MCYYSEHIFMYPFRWYNEEVESKRFSDQISLGKLNVKESAKWKRKYLDYKDPNIYNEMNYYYPFVHDALYDIGDEKQDSGNKHPKETLLYHFERQEPSKVDVTYTIDCQNGTFVLDVKDITIDLYSTGVGVIIFYFANSRYESREDILSINRYGRRVFPSFAVDVKFRNEVARSLRFDGLLDNYQEDFSGYAVSYGNDIRMVAQSNTPAKFLNTFIHEVAPDITPKPVIDDRMFMMSYYKNDDLSLEFQNYDVTEAYTHSQQSKDFWFQFVHNATCNNDKLKQELLKKSTYLRWQKYGTLYGVSKGSFQMLLSNSSPQYLVDYFKGMFVRMAELLLVQRASVLRFSREVTSLSRMTGSKDLSSNISSLYKEYIRFINQIHFREVSAQDQGIELYKMLYDQFGLEEQVDKLDSEIEELFNYVSLEEDRKSNGRMSLLTYVATIFGTLSMCFGFFGMNAVDQGRILHVGALSQLFITIGVAIPIFIFVYVKNKKR